MRKPVHFRIEYTKAADKFMENHENIRTAYEKSICRLISGSHSELVDVKRIAGPNADYYRMRTGKYRVIYTIIRGTIVVVRALTAGSRGDVYKKPNASH